jgi:tRNA-specific 2-thiouridylase
MPTGKRERVVVAMSGGVDSSVAAMRLAREGHEVIGLFMRTGVEGADTGRRTCCSLADAEDARAVARALDIRFHVLNFDVEFRALIDHFCDSYARGRTPNPCILCNRDFKFGRLLRFADALGASHVATGHYARLARDNGRTVMRRGADRAKDQSYVLFCLSQQQLARALFPLGDFTKEEVRGMAAEAGLPVRQKPESQDICFVPDRDYGRLLRERIPDRLHPGPVKSTAGETLAEHPGIAFFTIGQRHGLGVALGRPAYVVRIDADTSTVVVGDRDDLLAAELVAERVNWVSAASAAEAARCGVQIRYQHRPAPASLAPLDGDCVRVRFDEPQRAVTPGQAAVFYRDDLLLGGGWIASTEHKTGSDPLIKRHKEGSRRGQTP